MKGKVSLITGANRGIGRAVAQGLAGLETTLVIVCRDRGRGEAALEDIIAESGNANAHLMVADLSSQAAIRQLAFECKASFSRLDVLIHNAGLVKRKRIVTEDGIEATLAVNHLARRKILFQEVVRFFKQSSVDLLSFEEVRSGLRLNQKLERGLQEIPLDRIRGSVGRYDDFTIDFLPRKRHLRQRWERIDVAMRAGKTPPIEVY